MTADPVIYDGTGRSQPEQRRLRAGPLNLVYEAGDLRYVRLGGAEVCRRWYAAVRDADWGTVPGVVTDEVIETRADSFRIRYTSTHRQGEIHFVWRADISGASDGTLRFEFDGEAKATFRRNRIGFCILHPIRECVGARTTLSHPDGSTTQTEFPRLIAPLNPFRELAGLSHEVAPDLGAEWRFEGDIFETEDQRNWTDASFKTFCTPLRLPFPVEVNAGDRVRQVVTLAIRGTVPAAIRRTHGSVFTIAGPSVSCLPEIGLCAAGHGQPFTSRETELLRQLRPTHLRVELDLWTEDYHHCLKRAATEAAALGAGLEVAVGVSDADWDETVGLVRVLQDIQPPVRRGLAFHRRLLPGSEEWLRPVVEAFARYDASVPIHAGTQANFCELNRGRPPIELLGGVCFSINPQVHAFDNRSLVETCAALVDAVESARALGGSLPVAVTPITLKARLNPYATRPPAPTPRDELPPRVDVRQMSLFGAGWTLAALKYLAEAGVASVTFYEATGWLGVIEQESGCRLPRLFSSRPGMVFPLYHVLADANELIGGQVLPSVSTDPLAFDGLVIRRGDRTRVMLANLTDRAQTLTINGLPPRVSIRVLDETTFDRATCDDPIGFRDPPGDPRHTREGTLTLELRPYAYARLDSD